MRKDYLFFVICCLLYIFISAIDIFFLQINVLYLSIASILVWGALCFIAIKELIVIDKAKRRFKHYLFAITASLVFLSMVIRAIIR